jgi:hypothetical protein
MLVWGFIGDAGDYKTIAVAVGAVLPVASPGSLIGSYVV